MNTQNQKQFIKMLDSDKLTTIPPINIELELDVLATVALKPEFNFKINELTEDCFYNENKKIYQVFKKMFNEENIIDIATLSSKVNCLNLFNRNYTVLSYQLDSQIKELKELAKRRALQKVAYKIMSMIKENKESINIKNYILSAVTENKIDDRLSTAKIDDKLEEYMTKISPAIKTGFEKFDSVVGGFLNGTMNLIASAQGIGKTSYVINILRYVCNNGFKVLFISLEMSFISLHAKLISLISKVEFKKIMLSKKFTDEEWKRIIAARAEIHDYKLLRLGEKDITTQDIRAYLMSNKPDMVIIDYMQLIKPIKDGTLYENATNISRELKILSTQFDIPFLVISSINRDYSDRHDFTPRISDIRHSGQIEFDCDVVILLHRESAFKDYDEEKVIGMTKEEYEHKTELLIAKNRFGEANLKICYKFTGATGLFEEEGGKIYEQQTVN